MKKIHIQKSILKYEYYTLNLSKTTIAKKHKTSMNVIGRIMKEHGIKNKPSGWGRKKSINEKLICKQYRTKKKSTIEIAKLHGVSSSLIRDTLRENGIKLRDLSTAACLGRKKQEKYYHKKEWLLEQKQKGITQRALAKQCGIARSTMGRICKDHNIYWIDDNYKKKIVPAHIINNLYYKQGLSIIDIAKQLGTYPKTIKRSMKFHKIPVKTRSEWVKDAWKKTRKVLSRRCLTPSGISKSVYLSSINDYDKANTSASIDTLTAGYTVKPTFKVIGDVTLVPGGYGAFGILLENKSDKVQCHICGEWYKSLGQHVKMAHGVSGAEYRDIFGFSANTALVSTKLSIMHSKKAKKLIEEGKFVFKKKHDKERLLRIRLSKNKMARSLKKAKNTVEFRNKHNTCKQQILSRYRIVTEQVGREASTREIRKYDENLISVIQKRFGSITAFRQFYGIIFQNKANCKYSREKVLAIYRNHYLETKKIPTVKDLPISLHTIQKYIGSHRQALVMAALDQIHLPSSLKKMNGGVPLRRRR